MFKSIVSKVKGFISSKIVVPTLAAVAVLTGASTQAHAVAVLDLSGVGSAITAELTPALTAAMPIAGMLMAVTIGWKLFRRFVK